MLRLPCAGMFPEGKSLCFTDADDDRADKRWHCIPWMNSLLIELILPVAI